MKKSAWTLITTTLTIAAWPALAQPLPAEQEAIRAHVVYLASDDLHGREAGSADYGRAAEYVAERMKAAGLVPAGAKGGWLQPVPLIGAKLAAPPTMELFIGDKAVALEFGADFTATRPSPGPEEVDVRAQVVFAGYGVVDPVLGIDDYAGLDVRGKIVAILPAGPHGLNSEVSAHLTHPVVRARNAAARGAIGVVALETTRSRASFASGHRYWDMKAMLWSGSDGKPRDDGARALGALSLAGAAKLFEGFTVSYSQILEADKAGRKLPTGALPATLQVKQRYTVSQVSSPNVAGVLLGSDPKLRGEYVVLSAHLDHIGITRPVNGDSINNGAMDNAIGIASMLEVAKRMARGKAPRRSVLFVAVTAEEKGLVGSDYFATFPTVPKDRIVANVNLDMPILTYRFTDLVAIGAERSGIGPHAAAAAKRLGFTLVPDPTPQEASFVRTDHYSFVKQGVPSVTLAPGNGGGGAAAREHFRKNDYHQPSDEVDLPFDWVAAESFVAVNEALARGIADAPARPRWAKGDYFGTLFKGPVAE
ncbi:MAG: M28 family peptidase [Alphaproteobacteria bacterium]|nr:MAG: M28 family peptidase [Alphaproteobacteria bacterium]